MIVKKQDDNAKSGIWLSSYYIGGLDSSAYVYKDANGKIKKQSVELGQYDADADQYEILAGLELSDYIAFK